jgi:hypothetical protein
LASFSCGSYTILALAFELGQSSPLPNWDYTSNRFVSLGLVEEKKMKDTLVCLLTV